MKYLSLILVASIFPVFLAHADTQEYVTVEEGETLMSISSRVFGTKARWNEIYKLNRAVLPNPNALLPGMILKVVYSSAEPASVAEPRLVPVDAATGAANQSAPLNAFTEMELPQ